jgi:hypothetical protein
MAEPRSYRRPVTLSRIAAVLVILVGVFLAAYFLIDDTPAAWMIRLSWAGAITAGLAAVVSAIVRITDAEL